VYTDWQLSRCKQKGEGNRMSPINHDSLRRAVPPGYDQYREDIARGKIETVEYFSLTVGCKRKTMIYIPPGYSDGQGGYNVLYLLHGIGGDEGECCNHSW